jgi:hypothetical protein
MNLHTMTIADFKARNGIKPNEQLFDGHIHVTKNTVLIETF